ncbi:hypothetical protein ACJA28_01775 [Mesomycoplasma moatsii]|uniref:hypothetical protein n=1 Tax=Mesomycoplasma moatsii TaxID=171287 RepID=UPI00041E1D11
MSIIKTKKIKKQFIITSLMLTTIIVPTTTIANINKISLNKSTISKSIIAKTNSLPSIDINDIVNGLTNIQVKNNIEKYKEKILTKIKKIIHNDEINTIEINTKNILLIDNNMYLHYTYEMFNKEKYGSDIELRGFNPNDENNGNINLIKNDEILISYNELPKNSLTENFDSLSSENKKSEIIKIICNNLSLFISTSSNINETYNFIAKKILIDGLGTPITIKNNELKFNIVINNAKTEKSTLVKITNIIFNNTNRINKNKIGIIVGGIMMVIGGISLLCITSFLIYKKTQKEITKIK